MPIPTTPPKKKKVTHAPNTVAAQVEARNKKYGLLNPRTQEEASQYKAQEEKQSLGNVKAHPEEADYSENVKRNVGFALAKRAEREKYRPLLPEFQQIQQEKISSEAEVPITEKFEDIIEQPEGVKEYQEEETKEKKEMPQWYQDISKFFADIVLPFSSEETRQKMGTGQWLEAGEAAGVAAQGLGTAAAVALPIAGLAGKGAQAVGVVGKGAQAAGTAGKVAQTGLATAKQISYLKGLGLTAPKGLTFAKATAAISKATGTTLGKSRAITMARQSWAAKLFKGAKAIKAGTALVVSGAGTKLILTNQLAQADSLRSESESTIREAVTKATSIPSGADKPLLSYEEAYEIIAEQEQNILSAESGIKLITDNDLLNWLATGKDIQTKFANAKKITIPILGYRALETGMMALQSKAQEKTEEDVWAEYGL